MAIITDGKNFNVSLTNKDSDWYSLLQFCICKVNPRYYKNIEIKKERIWWLHWSGLNNNVKFPYEWSVSTFTVCYKGFLRYINKKYQLGICITDTM